jgi:hypothetical protein
MRLRTKTLTALLLLIAGIAAPTLVLASLDHKMLVEARVRETIPEARLSGTGSMRVFGIHIYDARLFVGSDGVSDDLTADQPYALDLRYARDFKGAAIAQRTRKEMERLELGNNSQRRQWEAALAAIFPDIRKGDHLTGIYRPEGYTEFLKNGMPIGRIEGAEFSRSFFAIWLHPDSRAPDVRAALLGQARSL